MCPGFSEAIAHLTNAEGVGVDAWGGNEMKGPLGIGTASEQWSSNVYNNATGMYEYDNKWTYMANPDVQGFLRMGDAVTGVEVSVSDIYRAPAISTELDDAVGPLYYARHWQQRKSKRDGCHNACSGRKRRPA